METEGDAYLKTPDYELSFLVRNSIDMHASVGALLALFVLSSWKLSGVFNRNVMGHPGNKQQIGLLAQLFKSKENKSV